VRIEPPLLLAPMAGHTHAGFRTLVRELGSCGMVCSELISSHALEVAPTSRKTRELFDWSERESPLAVQLFGGVPEEMARAARIVVERGADVVDINMGCWVPKVAKKGCGAALLDDLPRATAVVEAVCDAVDVPVSVKIRIGFHEGEPTALPFAQAAAAAGVSLITVHGRYAQQGFRGQSDHSLTAQVRGALPPSVKVIANGDITDLVSARAVIAQTGCDGLMLGRAALHRPWLFAELANGLCGRSSPATRCDPLVVARRHVQLSRELIDKPEWVLVRELRGQLLPYRLAAGTPQEEALKKTLLEVASFSDLERFFDQVEDARLTV
jgi:tRNA-dihydrouridine synthase B